MGCGLDRRSLNVIETAAPHIHRQATAIGLVNDHLRSLAADSDALVSSGEVLAGDKCLAGTARTNLEHDAPAVDRSGFGGDKAEDQC